MNIIKTAHEKKGKYAVKRKEKNLENEFYIFKVKHKIEKYIVNYVP